MTKKNLKATLFHQSAHLLEQDLLVPECLLSFLRFN